MLGLDYLLSPMTTRQFTEDYLGKKAVRIAGEYEKFPDLFSWNDLNAIVNDRFYGNSKIKIVHQGKVLPREEIINADKWMRAGASLVVDSIHNLDSVLQEFNSHVARDLNSPTWINCYVSWPQKQGFDNHIDFHDVLIIQTEGEKRWRVYEPTTLEIPIEKQRGKSPGASPDDDTYYLECVLRKGDVLYIPRGHWHYAVSETPCMHLTLSIQPRSGADFLEWFLNRLMDKEIVLREDFPVVDCPELGGNLAHAGLREHLDRIRKLLHEALDDESLDGALIEYLMTTNPIRKEVNFPFESDSAVNLDDMTVFTKPSSQKFVIDHRDDIPDTIILARGHVLDLRNIPKPVLTRVFADPAPFSGRDLLSLDTGVEWPELRQFLRELYNIGMLTVDVDDPDE